MSGSKHFDIAVVGSLNMDIVVSAKQMPKIGETITGQAIHYIPGGKGANQAVGCARLESRVVMLGAVGADAFGVRLIDEMRDAGVHMDEVLTLDNPTGTATIVHTPEDNCIIVVPGANGEYTTERLAGATHYLQQAKVVVAQLEIPLSTVEHALRTARDAGAVTILNPAPAASLSAELLRLADYLTPNETELEGLSGRTFETDEELTAILADWERTYAHKVIVTRGARGCSYLDDSGELVTVAPPAVQVVDTTGAGDAFNAALAYGLSEAWTLAESVRFAVRASALSVTRFGAQAGMPTRAEVIEKGAGI